MKRILSIIVLVCLLFTSLYIPSVFATDGTTATKTYLMPLIEFNTSADVKVTSSESTTWYSGSLIEYNENGYAQIFKTPALWSSVNSKFANIPAAVTTNQKMIIKAQIHPGGISMRYRIRFKDSSGNYKSSVIFKAAGTDGSLKASIGNASDEDAGTGSTSVGSIPDIYNDGWLDCVAVIDMDQSKTNYPMTVYYNSSTKAESITTQMVKTAVNSGTLWGLNIQSESSGTTTTYLDNTAIYTVESNSVPALNVGVEGTRLVFTNEVMKADLVNTADNTLSVIKVNGSYLPLDKLIPEKGGLSFNISLDVLNPGDNAVDVSEVKDIFGNSVASNTSLTVANRNFKTWNMPTSTFDSSDEIITSSYTNSMSTKWHSQSSSAYWLNDDGTLGMFANGSAAYNHRPQRVFEEQVSVTSAAENKKLVMKAQIYPGNVNMRYRLGSTSSSTLPTVATPFFVGGTEGSLRGKVGVSTGTVNGETSYSSVTDIYNGWVDAIAVIDLDYTKENAPVTVYFNGEKRTSTLPQDVMTAAKSGKLGAITIQSEGTGKGTSKLDNAGTYTVLSNYLPPLTATSTKSGIYEFSNEVAKIDLVNPSDSTVSVIKANGNYLPIDAIKPKMGYMSFEIDSAYLAKGENTIDLSGVKDIFGTSLSGTKTFKIVKYTNEKIINMPLDDFSDPDKSYPNVTTNGYGLEWGATSGQPVIWQEGGFLRIFSETADAWNSQARRKFAVDFPDEKTTSYKIVGKMAIKSDTSGICLRLVDLSGTPTSIAAIFKTINSNMFLRALTDSVSDATSGFTVQDLYDGWYEVIFVIDVDAIGDATETSYDLITYVNGRKHTTKLPSTFFVSNFDGLRLQSSVAKSYAYIDDTEVYTVVKGSMPDFKVTNTQVNGNTVHFDVSNEITLTELTDENDLTKSVITANGAPLMMEGIKVDRDSLGFTLDEKAFKYVFSSEIEINLENIYDILGNKITGEKIYSHTITRNYGEKIVDDGTNVVGLFKGNNNFKIEKSLINYTESDKKVRVIGAIYDKSGNLIKTKISEDDTIAKESMSVLSVDFGKLPEYINEYYDVKLYVWNDENHPYFPSEDVEKYKQIVILKFDDLQGTDASMATTQKMIDSLKEQDVIASFGVIGRTFDNDEGDANRLATVKGWYDEGFEIWHHGYYHYQSEYPDKANGEPVSAESMKESFQKTMDIFSEAGINITTFGSPHNNAGETFVKMLEENFPEIEVLLKVSAGSEYSTKMFINDNLYLESDGMDYEYFLNSYNSLGKGVFVAQAHAPSWNDASFAEWDKALKVMKDNNVMFMTPHQYYTWVKWKESK